MAQTNLGGALTVFEAAYRAGVRRLVWTSSIAVYGDQPTLDPVTEEAPLRPRSFYADTKVAGEALLHGYVARYGLDAIALRLSTVYGPRRRTQCALRDIIRAARAGRPAIVAAPGTSHRPYLHVEGAATAVLLALAAPAEHQFAYSITGGIWLPEVEIAGMIGDLLPGLAIAHEPDAWNEGHLGPLVLDAAQRDLGYAPRVALRDGLAGLIAQLGAAADGSA